MGEPATLKNTVTFDRILVDPCILLLKTVTVNMLQVTTTTT